MESRKISPSAIGSQSEGSSPSPLSASTLETDSPSISSPPSSTALFSITPTPPSIVTFIYPSNFNSKEFIELPDSPSGAVVGSLFVPPNLSNRDNTTLIASYGDSGGNATSNGQILVSIIVNITLLDDQGSSLSQLDSPLSICLVLTNNTRKDDTVCLSYYDENRDWWECEDECLTTISPRRGKDDGRRKGDLLCGTTGHLTNFALLLNGNNQQDPCQHSEDDISVLAWVSLAMVAGAILVVALSVVAVEIRTRRRARLLNRQLARSFPVRP